MWSSLFVTALAASFFLCLAAIMLQEQGEASL